MFRKGDNLTHLRDFNISIEKLNEDLFAALYPVIIFIGLEAVFGFIGNISILCVYIKLYLRCNFRYFVLCLAIYDLTSCIATLPAEIFSEFHWYDFRCSWFCKIKSYFNVFTVWGSAFTLLLLAFDRYRKVCQPLGWQIQPSCAFKLCALGMILAALVSVPASVFWGIQTYVYSVGNVSVTVSICEKSGLYANAIYPFIYIASVYVLPIGVMMAAICVWNILTAKQMFCKMNELRNSSSASMVDHNPDVPRNASHSGNKITIGSFVSSSIHKFVKLKKSFQTRNGHCGSHQPRRNSMTSLTSFTLVELPSRNRFYITSDFGESRPTQQETDEVHCYNERHSRHMPNNSTGSDHRHIPNDSAGSDNAVDRVFSREIRSEGTYLRRKRKTMMMLILTSVFMFTMALYVILISIVAEKYGIFREMSNSEKAVYFFFLRIYFINSVINPILYGLMDPRFRRGLKRIYCSCVGNKKYT